MNAILLTSMSELMKNAALNTLLVMGTVFSVLIIIMLVISSFTLFGKGKKKDEKSTSVDKAVAQITAAEESDESDDTELVAVIAAAIAAYEGSSSTDGYVVRSIRRVR